MELVLTKNNPLIVILGLFLVMTMMMSEVSAVHSQGLHWGYEEGQEFYFNEKWLFYHGDEGEPTIQESNYLLIDPEHYPIEDPVTNDSYPPRTHFDVHWINGSPAGDEYILVGRNVAVPIGNWSLLSKVYDAYFSKVLSTENHTYSFQLVETGSEWGYTSVRTSYLIIRTRYWVDTTCYTYSKQDGVLLLLTYESVESWSNATTRYSFSRLPMNPETQAILATGLAAGVIISVLVVFTRILKR